MQIHSNNARGNVLFATLFITGLISIYLGSYLTMVRNENQLTVRSQTWNMAIPIAEAGIEEAMTHLQVTYPAMSTANGWDLVNGYYMKTRWLNTNEYYRVGIFPPGSPNEKTPVIVSQGFSRVPSKNKFISRTIRVNTKVDGYTMPGMVVMTTANMNGNKLVLDSFNSTNSAFSTDGKYDASKRGDKAYLGTMSTITNAIDLGNADVWGKIASAHNGSPPVIGSQSTVGNKAWHTANNKGLQPGAYSDDVNMTVDVPKAPFTSGFAPPLDVLLGASILTTGDYAVEHLTGKVIVMGKARLLVTKSFNISSITVSNLTGTASLELYVAAPNVNIKGMLNVQGRAPNFKYYGLPANPALGWPGNQTLDAGGNGQMTGMFYAPMTSMVLHGGGSAAEDFSGACLVKSVSMGGHYNFHFDESCESEMLKGYVAVSWDEISADWETILAKTLAAKALY